MNWTECIGVLQGYLENNPLIVLGSGASMPYGLPSMKILAEEIKKSDSIISDPNFSVFCTAMDGLGLEEAIDSVELLPQTLNEIRRIVWKTVNERDLAYFDSNPTTPPEALAELLHKILAPTPNKAVIVTTNYDRLAEYSADQVGATTVTGFEGCLIKKLELPNLQLKTRRTRARERVVDIWKVHGSLDWFIASDGTVASFPLTRNIPSALQPLIIPPGKEKYSATHDEPYRTVIAEADNAFVQSGAYLCIGYGFNDEHIQPKLLAQISKGKPIVVLTRTMTSACRKHIVDAGIKKFLVFEYADDTHTKVHGNGWEEMYDGQYWLLDNFLKIW